MYKVFNTDTEQLLSSYSVDVYKNMHVGYTNSLGHALKFSSVVDAYSTIRKLKGDHLVFSEKSTIVKIDSIEHNLELDVYYPNYLVVPRTQVDDKEAIMVLLEGAVEVDFNDYVAIEISDVEYEVLL